MRASEVLSLRKQDVALPDDLRMQQFGSRIAGVNIECAKTGPTQFTPIRDQVAIALITTFLQRSSVSNSDTDRLFPVSYRVYNRCFKEAANFFALPPRFTTHSARIGGAVHDFCTGTSAETIASVGRWSSFSSLQHYLNNGRAWIIRIPISDTSQERINVHKKSFEETIALCIEFSQGRTTPSAILPRAQSD